MPGMVRACSRALASPPCSPERTESEPAKGQRDANCNCQTTAACSSGMIFAVLLHGSSGANEGHDEEDESRDLEPQLVSGAPERAACGADAAHDRAERAVAPGLPSGDLSHHP